MSTQWKPDGYSSVSPYLMVDGAQRVIDFLKQVFNATELRRQADPDGSIRHVEVRLEDGSVIMMADGGGDFPAFPAWMHVYVPDVDATYKRALEVGGVSVQEPKQNEGEVDRRGGVKDPAGNTWWIATQVE
jgi:PhnB protein